MMSLFRNRIGDVVLSVAVILVAGYAVYKGIEFVRFDSLNRANARVLEVDFAKLPPQAELMRLQEGLSVWRDVPGVRAMALQDVKDVGTALSQLPSASISNSVELLRVDPINAGAWLDLATASWSNPNARAVSFAAWDMSALVAPREWWAMRRRVVFLLAVWPEAPEAQRRRLFFEVGALIGNSIRFRREWFGMLANLSAESRRDVEDAFRLYDPTYGQR